MKLQAIRGFKDWLPEEFVKFDYLVSVAKGWLKRFNFKEVKIPILEKTDLFVRSIGEVTDIVQKETYSFQDRNKEWVTLRPEATAGICRFVIEHGLHTKPKPLKFFTVGPMFRHERPQKGRLREFYQVDAEVFGELNPYMEADLILLVKTVLSDPLNGDFTPFRIELNSLGCRGCRKDYREELVKFLRQKKSLLCEVCQERLERNPLRVLDCKNEACKEVVKEAPVILDYLCEECNEHFTTLKKVLRGLSVEYEINPWLVRGLDYYTRTIFEVKAQGLGAQDTVAAGGRYDHLLSELGGASLPAIGFAIGLERWSLVVFERNPELGEKLEKSLNPDVFLAVMDEERFLNAGRLALEMRNLGLKVEATYEKRGLKGLLKQADKLRARYALILGEREFETGIAILKDMEKGFQTEVSFKDLKDLAKGVFSVVSGDREGKDGNSSLS